MSFRLFVYYCAAWGAAAALVGWFLGRLIASEETLGGGALKGMSLGLFLALGLTYLDAVAAGSRRDLTNLLLRLTVSLLLGIVGGLLGGLVGQWLYQLTRVSLLRTVGWILTGVL